MTGLMRNSLTTQRGISLVEVMVAMTIGIFLSIGAVNVYLTNSRGYVENEEMARMQENGRFALRFLARELSMSGFLSGVEPENVTPFAVTGDCATNWATNPLVSVEIVNNTTGASAVTSAGTTLGCVSDLQAGSDIITVKRLAGTPSVEDGTSNSSVSGKFTYLRIDNGTGTNGFTTGSFGSINTNIDVWRYIARAIFVRNYSQAARDNIPSLCAATLNAAMENNCVAEGVEAFQIEFGVDTNGDNSANYFVTNPDTSSNDVVAARIYVLMRSIGEVGGYSNDAVYQMGSTAVNGGAAFNDGYYRKVYSTTVKLRNPMRL